MFRAPKSGRGFTVVELHTLKTIAKAGSHGATYFDVQCQLGLLPQTASPVCHALRTDGLIARNGKRRPSQTGHDCYVYVVTNRGRRLIASMRKAVQK
jgi:DNA-binding MarR family transcriptional regulator